VDEPEVQFSLNEATTVVCSQRRSKMKPFGIKSILLSFAIAVTMCSRAIKRKSLSKAGAFAAFVVGFLSVATGFRGMSLLIFYQVRATEMDFCLN
jgi:uncharacterized membrane protein